MPSQVAIYMAAYYQTLRLLEAAKIKAKRQADRSLDPLAAAACLDLVEEIALLKRGHESFMAQYSDPLSPPPPEVVQKARELADALGKQIAQRDTAEAILQIATWIVNAWNDLPSGLAGDGQIELAGPVGALKSAFPVSAAPRRRKNSAWLEASQ